MTLSLLPDGNNADAWHLWLEENCDKGNAFMAVQIAEAMDDLMARSTLLDRMQTVRLIIIDQDHAVCVGGKFDGWKMWRHPDGQWVSKEKLSQESRP